MDHTTPSDVTGNEWMTVRNVDRTLLRHLRPREDLLAEATEGIEKHRKCDVTIRILDLNTAQPLRDASLAIEQIDHAFDFGCSHGFTFAQVRDDPVQQARAALFVDLFNCTTAKCYWDECWHQPIEKRQGIRVTQRFVDEIDWALANRLRVRGHPLVWTVPKAIPHWVTKYPYQKQLQWMEHHVRSLIQCTRGRVKLWDLVNEMLWEPSLRNLPRREWPHIENVSELLTYIEPAIQWAREEDSSSTYVLNDYGLELNLVKMGDKTVSATMQRARFAELITEMRKRNCAPDAIGTQMHDGTWVPMDVFKRVLDELATTGLPVQVTEFWAHDKACAQIDRFSPEQLRDAKIQYVTDSIMVAFSHPAVTHFTCWGSEMFYEDGDNTVRHYKAAWNPSKVYDAVHALVKEKWWTARTNLTLNQDGEASSRVGHGQYRVTIGRASGAHAVRYLHIHGRRSTLTVEI